MQRGCNGPQTFAVAIGPDGTPYFECPGRLVTPTTALVCRLYPLVECGILPCSGGALEQPATLMEALAIVGAEVGKLREREMEKARGG